MMDERSTERPGARTKCSRAALLSSGSAVQCSDRRRRACLPLEASMHAGTIATPRRYQNQNSACANQCDVAAPVRCCCCQYRQNVPDRDEIDPSPPQTRTVASFGRDPVLFFSSFFSHALLFGTTTVLEKGIVMCYIPQRVEELMLSVPVGQSIDVRAYSTTANYRARYLLTNVALIDRPWPIGAAGWLLCLGVSALEDICVPVITAPYVCRSF
jgi:hypothetical protein